ncbi:MAG: hypothetical protein ACRCVT_14560 [Leadbetterella sp.]
MEKNKSNYFGASLLIGSGIILFLWVNDFINLSITKLASYWPVLLILAGVSVLFDNRKSAYNSVTALLIAFCIPLAIFSFISKKVDKFKNNFWENNIEFSTSDKDENERTTSKPTILIPYTDQTKTVDLRINANAVSFKLGEPTTQNSVEAFAKSGLINVFSTDSSKGDNQDVQLDFKLNNEKTNFKIRDIDNKIKVSLHKAPIWNFDMNLGTSAIDLDFEDYKVAKCYVSTGASELKLKFGKLLPEADVNISSGLSNIRIKVPRESACRITMVEGLSSNDFDGFTKMGNGVWETEGYESASNKIKINLSTGVSEIRVSRY